jgi:hypothetical protein
LSVGIFLKMFVGNFWCDLIFKAFLWLIITLFLAFDVKGDIEPLFTKLPILRSSNKPLDVISRRSVALNQNANLSFSTVQLDLNEYLLLGTRVDKVSSAGASKSSFSEQGYLFSNSDQGAGLAGDFVISYATDGKGQKALTALFRDEKGNHYTLNKKPSGNNYYLDKENHNHKAPCGHDYHDLGPHLHNHSHSHHQDYQASDSTESIIIDVLVMYTPQARQEAGGTAAMEAIIAQAITLSNESYKNSGLANIKLNLVHKAETKDNERQNYIDNLSFLQQDGEGVFDEVHHLREQYHADMVAMLVTSGVYCGVGYTPGTIPALQSGDFAFSLTSINCVNYYTFGHELGHNLGLHHDVANAPADLPYAGSYGWRWTGSNNILYRSVMAYSPGIRMPYFSNPDINHLGAATGVSGTANNAGTLLAVAQFAKDYRFNPNPNSGGGNEGGGNEEEGGEAEPELNKLEMLATLLRSRQKTKRFKITVKTYDQHNNIIAGQYVELYQFRPRRPDRLIRSGTSDMRGLSVNFRLRKSRRMRIYAASGDLQTEKIRLR